MFLYILQRHDMSFAFEYFAIYQAASLFPALQPWWIGRLKHLLAVSKVVTARMTPLAA